jgi:hypothetical protein
MENILIIEGTVKKRSIETLPGGLIKFDLFHTPKDDSNWSASREFMIITIYANQLIQDNLAENLRPDALVRLRGKLVFNKQYCVTAESIEILKESPYEVYDRSNVSRRNSTVF